MAAGSWAISILIDWPHANERAPTELLCQNWSIYASLLPRSPTQIESPLSVAAWLRNLCALVPLSAGSKFKSARPAERKRKRQGQRVKGRPNWALGGGGAAMLRVINKFHCVTCPAAREKFGRSLAAGWRREPRWPANGAPARTKPRLASDKLLSSARLRQPEVAPLWASSRSSAATKTKATARTKTKAKAKGKTKGKTKTEAKTKTRVKRRSCALLCLWAKDLFNLPLAL